MHLKKSLILFFIVSILLQACFTPREQSPINQQYINLANLYNPKATTIFPEFTVYNKNDSITVVYNYFYLPQLRFLMAKGGEQAKILLNYKLTPSLTNRKVIDTITKILTIRYNKNRRELIFPVQLRPNHDTGFLLNIYVKDLYRKKSNLKFIYNDKSSRNSPNNFLVKDARSFRPVFGNVVYPGHQYIIQHNSGQDSLFIYHYPLDTTLPKPPFYLGGRTRKIYADTIMKIPSLQAVEFSTPGIYLITADSLVQRGKTLVLFNPYYPQIDRASQMIPPLAYLTTTEEYARLLHSYSPKLTVDSFWISVTENPQQSKELIKAYYHRVFLANYYFTTHKQGWQTDRGMIYIIFGPPPVVYKFEDKEQWIYYFAEKGKYISFVFRKNKSRFSDQDYILVPSAQYREFWQYAVKQWRSGNIP